MTSIKSGYASSGGTDIGNNCVAFAHCGNTHCYGECSFDRKTDYAWNTSRPSTPLCEYGRPVPSTVSFPAGRYGSASHVTWKCVRGGGGFTDDNCYAQRVAPVAPGCGSRATTYTWNTTSWPSGSRWCAPGSSGANHSNGRRNLSGMPQPGQTTYWGCTRDGATADCEATKAAQPLPQCGNRATTYTWNTTSWPSGSRWCAPGSSGANHSNGRRNLSGMPQPGQTTYWGCARAGSVADCAATKAAPPQPRCGDRAGLFSWQTTAFPTGSRWCSVGSPERVTAAVFPQPNRPTQWKCNNGNLSVTCNATRRPNAACGTRATNYAWNATSYPSGSVWCAVGSPVHATGFPTPTYPVNWECDNAGARVSCQATKSWAPSCGSRARNYAWNEDAWELNDGTRWCAVGSTPGNNTQGTRSASSSVEPTHTSPSFWGCTRDGVTIDCEATKDAPPACQCGSANGTLSINQPTSNDFCTSGTVNLVNTRNRWEWTCEPQANVCASADGPCSAGCTDIDINAPAQVYLSHSGNTVDVSVSIEGYQNLDSANRGTCTIALNGHTENNVPILASGTTEIRTFNYSGPGATVTASCALNVDCGRSGNPDSETHSDTHTISSLCIERSCNTQGSCQQAPRAGVSSPADCQSTCTSNADCVQGAIIETRP